MKSSKPKVLHDVLGKTILARVLDAVQALDVERIHIIVGHEAEQVRQFLKENPPAVPVSVHLQEPQLGTGHALMQCVDELKQFNGTLLVTVADTPLLTGETLSALIAEHERKKATVTLLTTIVEDAKNYGRVLRDGSGKVTAIVEDKDASEEERKIRLINTAIYCFEWPEIEQGLRTLKNDNKQNEYYLTDVVGWAASSGRDTAGFVAQDWREVAGINSRLELAEANRLLRDITVQRLAAEGITILDAQSTWIAPEVKIGPDSTILPGCFLTGTIEIGSNCKIGPHTVMHGPVKIGDHCSIIQSQVAKTVLGSHCTVGPFAHLRDGNQIADHCRIGNFVEVKNAKIADHSNVSHLSYVGDAEVGSRCNLGAGTITANYDHITKMKQRTIVEDDASTGSNSVLVAPVTLGRGSMLAAGSVATKDVPAGALALSRAPQNNIDGYIDKKRKQHEDEHGT
jgi:bifunctional UDP-N-acetylglucosamine pyrophosphorylase/glucosamine-1-phosphate N-acetyltransferase